MKEQQPIGITELEQNLGNIDGALGKANRVSKTIGTPEFGRPELDISPSSQLNGTAYLDSAVRVGMVKEALEERAKPTLLLQKENVEKKISLKKQQVQLEKIRELVQRGFLSESVAEQAQRSLGSLNQAVVSTEVPSGPERSNFIFPDGKMFSNLTPQETKILTSLLGTSKEKPISSYEWAQSVYGNDNNGNSRSKIGSQLPKIKRKISEAGWEIVTDFHGPLRGKLSPAWYYLYQKEGIASGSQKSQAIDEGLSLAIGKPTEAPPNEIQISQTQTTTQPVQHEIGIESKPKSSPKNEPHSLKLLLRQLDREIDDRQAQQILDGLPPGVLKDYRSSRYKDESGRQYFTSVGKTATKAGFSVGPKQNLLFAEILQKAGIPIRIYEWTPYRRKRKSSILLTRDEERAIEALRKDQNTSRFLHHPVRLVCGEYNKDYPKSNQIQGSREYASPRGIFRELHIKAGGAGKKKYSDFFTPDCPVPVFKYNGGYGYPAEQKDALKAFIEKRAKELELARKT